MNRRAVATRVDDVAIAFGILCLAAWNAGCASVGGERGRYEHPQSGYRVPYPQQLAGSEAIAWRKLRVEDADLAFRGPNDVFMAISSHCDESEQDPATLGRQLLVGLANRTAVASERFEFAGGHAYSQIVEAAQGEAAVRTRTMTLVRGGCVVDWVFAASGLFSDLEAVFDSWWRAFDPGSMPGSRDDSVELRP